jgi:tetratricopeptide (TPR) repeat protein
VKELFHKTLNYRKYTYALALILAAYLITGCSVKKNTSLTRTFHAITTKYNILFNGNEAFKKGMKQVDQGYTEDYTRILSVFKFSNDKVRQLCSSSMDRTSNKSSKAISLHSIKAKPNYNPKKLSKSEKDFYNKREYNKYIDDCYLLIGKAHVYKHEYPLAIETFNFMLRDFDKEDSRYEASIWLARTTNELNDFKESERLLNSLKGEEELPKKLNAEVSSTYADYYIKQKDYKSAIPWLEKAIEGTHKKKVKVRYYFILAQLYQNTGNYARAMECFNKVIKMNPPYDMNFSARINRATSFEVGQADSKEIRKQLRKLLREQKNKEYQDQIYYALGNIDFKESKVPDAIENYKSSITKSVNNTYQKVASCLTLADILYNERSYLPAAAYYDSALVLIDAKYPNYAQISVKAASLKRLADNVNAVFIEDSLQRIAKMPEKKRIAFIDSIIDAVKKKEAAAAEEENQRRQDMYYNQTTSTKTDLSSSSAKWYFYNPTSIGIGINDFKTRWGSRKLEDNWRRKNKKQMSIAESSDNPETGGTKLDSKQKKVLSKTSRDFYLQNLPMNDSLKQVSNEKIINGLYVSGTIYKEELNEPAMAATQFEELIKRFPDHKLALTSYYQLYLLFKQLGNMQKADMYAQALIAKYPESVYAKLLTNPSFIKDLLDKQNEVNRYYEQTYALYQQEQYENVLKNADYAMSKYPKHELLVKFAYIKALAIGKVNDVKTFKESLRLVMKDYADSSVTASCKNILDFLDHKFQQVKVEEDKQVAQEIYQFTPSEKHYICLVQPKNVDLNQLSFNIINFNLDNEGMENVTTSIEDFDKGVKVFTIKGFDDAKKAFDYHDRLMLYKDLFKDVTPSNPQFFIISGSNYTTLSKDKSVNKYLLFYNENYKR